MSQQKIDSFPVGLSKAEKDDLEKMISEFSLKSPLNTPAAEGTPIQTQLDNITRKLAELTEQVLRIDRQMAPLVELHRLSHQKSELLSQRLDDVIAALKEDE